MTTMTTMTIYDINNKVEEEMISGFDIDYGIYDNRVIDRSLNTQPYEDFVEETFGCGEYDDICDDEIVDFIDEFALSLKTNPRNRECWEKMYLYVENDLDDPSDNEPKKIITLYLYLFASSLHYEC